MSRRVVKLPELAWYGAGYVNIRFPEAWDVIVSPMEGYDAKPVEKAEVKAALRNPVGGKSLKRLSRGRKEAVIIVDDMTRPTRTYELLPPVLEELKRGGITRDHIRVIVGLGAHGACDRIDFAKKLGEKVVEEYPVYNHNPFGSHVDLGETSRGTPVQVNSEVMDCDLRIGVGLVVPHPQAGFGGGAKIILPGVVSMDTIAANHGDVGGFKSGDSQPHPSAGWGKVEGNVVRLDMEEAAKMAGLDAKLDVLVNGIGETTAVFYGDFVQEHRAAVNVARSHYATQIVPEADVVVANTYAKANEATLSLALANASVKQGGTIVIIANAPDGQVTHYLYGKFGKRFGGRLHRPSLTSPKFGKLILCSQFKVVDPFLPIVNPELITWVSSWSEAVEAVGRPATGKFRVAVYPNAETQAPREALQQP
ncbi:MAG: lactate racemase domain-containing protein [Candidatus Bathyarchaeia archaeon]